MGDKLQLENASREQKTGHCLPNEMLHHIFEKLPRRDLFRCREVCVQWRETADYVMESKNYKFWKQMCRQDHRNVYRQARSQCHPSLTWRSIYISLSLWRKLTSAKEICSEIKLHVQCSIVDPGIQLPRCHTWNGNVAVHKHGSIVYYDLETLEETNRIEISNYWGFQENDDVAAYRDHDNGSRLVIVPKNKGKLVFESVVLVDDVEYFIICDDEIYYTSKLSNSREIYICDLKDSFKCSFLQELQELGDLQPSLKAFGYTRDSLYCVCLYTDDYEGYMYKEYRVFTLYGVFVPTDELKDYEDVLKFQLYKYNLKLDTFKNVTPAFGNHNDLPIHYNGSFCVYGELVFSIKNRFLNVHHLPSLYLNVRADPVKQFDVTKLFKVSEYDLGALEVTSIDVMEKENGHAVILSTPHKVLILSLSHDL